MGKIDRRYAALYMKVGSYAFLYAGVTGLGNSLARNSFGIQNSQKSNPYEGVRIVKLPLHFLTCFI
jgi:hypothetical protein